MNCLIFDITDRKSRPFEVKDVWNPGNVLKGFLWLGPTSKYGALHITHVNGEECPQDVWSSPKMHYPYTSDGRSSWPNKLRAVLVFEKLDGTCVISYDYKDVNGKIYTTYKTRLTPVMAQPEFIVLWKEMLEKYKEIPMLSRNNGVTVIYELYGSANPIIIRYDHRIDTKVLFARTADGSIVTPDHVKGRNTLETAPLISVIFPEDDIHLKHSELKKYFNENLKVTENVKGTEVEKIYEGMEGAVMYATAEENSSCIQFKIKPDEIFDLCVKAAAGIPYHAIYTTVTNAFEEADVVTSDYVTELLEEEYEPRDIVRRKITIEKILAEVSAKVAVKRTVLPEYISLKESDPEFDIFVNKGKVMRYFAQVFGERGMDKKSVAKIYPVLYEFLGGER